MSCSGTNIFGDDTCEGDGLTPGQEQDLTDVVEKTQLQSFVAPDTTNFSGNLTVNGLPIGGGGSGDVVGPATSADNGVCFYNGTSGKLIKEIATIKYNPVANAVAVPDLSTTLTTSLNTDLQRISNIVSAVQLPEPITVLDGELDVKFIKSFEKNVELEFDDDEAILTATDITLNGSVASSGDIKVYDPTAVNLDQSILRKDRLEFSGIPADNALGLIRFDDGLSYKQIIMSVDKGNFVNQSRGIISVDGGTYQFNPNEFAMLNKRITLLSDPIGVLDAANKQYVDSSVEQAFIDPVINSSITLENQTTPNTLLLASVATGDNRIDSSGNLEINGSNLTMNLTGGTLTENVGNNKISIVSGNLTETISANKVINITAAHISTALSHTFNGALTSSTSVTTPLISGISTITNGSNININNIGGNLIISNDEVIINSSGGIDLTGAAFGISLGANQITTTKTTFIDTELVTKKYVDDSIPAGSPYELIFAATDQISNITTTGQKFQIRAPRDFTISKFKLSLNSTAGVNFSVTLFKNGVSFSSVFLPSLVQDTTIAESFLENDIISVNISNVGLGTASGLIVYLLE
jgi:hypothetical protein